MAKGCVAAAGFAPQLAAGVLSMTPHAQAGGPAKKPELLKLGK